MIYSSWFWNVLVNSPFCTVILPSCGTQPNVKPIWNLYHQKRSLNGLPIWEYPRGSHIWPANTGMIYSSWFWNVLVKYPFYNVILPSCGTQPDVKPIWNLYHQKRSLNGLFSGCTEIAFFSAKILYNHTKANKEFPTLI